MQAAVYDERICELGEGPFWHPERGQLFWFDILGRRLLTRAADRTQEWRFDEHVSAAGWIDRDTLLESAKRYGKSPYGQHLKNVADGKLRY